MANFHLTALGEVRDELRQTVTYLNGRSGRPVTVSDAVLQKFIKKFEADFKLALTPKLLRGKPIRKNGEYERRVSEFGPLAWAATRDRLMIKAVAIATLATSYAQQAGAGEITERHLMRALRQVKPECTITTDGPPPRAKRWDYCWGVM